MSKTKEEKIETFTELTKRINEILNDENLHPLEKGINTRDFELEVTGLASNTKFNKKLIEDVEKILNNSKGDYFDFTLFYVFFTWKRRNNYDSLKDFYDSYKKTFNKYTILIHIKGMAILAESNQPEILKKTIDEINSFINKPNSEFSDHVGILNLYVELVCSYCELKFDERNSDKINDLLKQALEYINKIIRKEEKEKENKKAYQKFYLNKGRILVLLKQYDIGEQEINKAISLIPLSQDRAMIFNNYSQYLAKSSMIKAYDLNIKALDNYKAEKIKEVNKYKLDTYKIITLVMAVIGFLLGSINIFTKVDDLFALLMLMIAYGGLMLILVGIVLVCFHFLFKNYKSDEKKLNPNEYKHEKTSFKIAIALIIIGIVVFVFSLIVVYLKMKNLIS